MPATTVNNLATKISDSDELSQSTTQAPKISDMVAAATNKKTFLADIPAATAVTAIARPSGILCSEIASADIKPDCKSTIVVEIATEPSGKLCKVRAAATKSALFSNLLPELSSFPAANRRIKTTAIPTASHNAMDSRSNPALSAVGINSKMLTTIIAVAAKSSAIAIR